jgi:uncharacterized membrane protein
MKRQTIIIGLITIPVVLISATIGFYASSILPSDLKMEHLGQVGDFAGGIINPILGLLNICIFVWLTITIQSSTERNEKESIEMNRRSTLMHLKYSEFNRFKESIDEALDQWSDAPSDEGKFKRFLVAYNVAEHRMGFLFPELQSLEENKRIRAYIMEASTALRSNQSESVNPNGISNTYGMLISRLGELAIS